MKTEKRMNSIVFALALVLILAAGRASADDQQAGQLRIGWASADLTPDGPVVVAGSSRARVSEGVLDPVTATALAIEFALGRELNCRQQATGPCRMAGIPSLIMIVLF